MALKQVVPSFANSLLRFYSPSIDSPLISDWNDLSFGGCSPTSKWEEELQQQINKGANSPFLNIMASRDCSLHYQDTLIGEALQQVQRRQQLDIGDSEGKIDISLDKYETSPYAEQILEYLNPFFKELKEDGLLSNGGDPRPGAFTRVIERFEQYAATNSKQTNDLKALMKVNKLLIPYIELDLPSSLVLKYNELDEDDPVLTFHQFNPLISEKIRELEVLLDRYDNKEVLCILVWSLHDNSLVCLPSVGLAPFPLCWSCHKSFGMHSCAKCGVAKYCGKECQQSDWKTAHKTLCIEMSAFAEKHKVLVI